MNKPQLLTTIVISVGIVAIGVPVHAQSQTCKNLCNPDFWKKSNTDFVTDFVTDIIRSKLEGVRSIDSNGATPLHFAAGFSQDNEVIKLLIELGSDLDTRAEFDFRLLSDFPAAYNTNSDSMFWNASTVFNAIATPLHWAAVLNTNNDVLLTLLNANTNFRVQDESGETFLHYAAALNANPDVILSLLDAGFDINARTEGLTTTTRLPDGEMVDLILTTSGLTPLHYAAGYNLNPDVIIALNNAGADINAHDEGRETPLHTAAAYNSNPNVIKVLIDAGADINARDEDEKTPLHWAAAFNTNPDVILALLNASPNIRAQDADGGTPLHLAAGFNTNPEVISSLLDAGIGINTYTKGLTTTTRLPDGEMVDLIISASGLTPLHYATSFNLRPNVIEVLLDAGADINVRSEDGKTPLHLAVENNAELYVISMLLDAGSDINARSEDGFTPLHFAAKHATNSRKIEILLDAGSDINARSESGYTPLHMAAEHNKNSHVLLLLLDLGANPIARTRDGKLPIDLAKENFSLKNSKGFWRLHDSSFQ